MTERDSHRASEDVEQGETARLLGSDADSNQGTSTNWKDYPSHLWAQTTSYIESLRHSRSERGKQRQVQGDDVDGPDRLHIPTERPRFSRLQGLRIEYPYLYWIIVSLLTLIIAIFFLLLIALAHLYLVTLRTPNDQLQSRIAQQSFSMDGPDEVKVLDVGSDGVTVSLVGRIGIDSDSALDEWLGRRQEKSWYTRTERDVIEWALGKIKGVQVDVGKVTLRSPDWSVPREIEPIHLIPENETSTSDLIYADGNTAFQAPTDLVTFQPDPLYIPLPAIGSAHATKKGPQANTILNLTLVLRPSGPDIFAFAKDALATKKAILDLNIGQIKIRGLNANELSKEKLSTFRHFSIPSFVDLSVGDTWRRLGQKIPHLDGNGTGKPDEFLNLTHYDFFEIGRDAVASMGQRALGIRAYAEAKNPLGKLLKGHVEYSLPFGVYLPLETGNATLTADGKEKEDKKPEDLVLLAAVASDPIDMNGEDKIKLQLQGRVVPPPQPPSFGKRDQIAFGAKVAEEVSKADAGADALSGFLSRFLSGKPNTVYVRGGSPFTEPSDEAILETSKEAEEPLPGGGSVLPSWLDKLLRTLLLPISFPGAEVTDLIQNVTINDLKITPHPFEKEKLLCSGTVMGVMNMPGELATVDVDITDLWPDILVFNGKPPSMKQGNDDSDNTLLAMRRNQKKDRKKEGDDDAPTPDPLPNPLPDHAFGRVTPHSWAPAKTYIDPEDPKRQRKLLYSELKDVPFTVLPGRGAEFRTFSWKIVTGEGARAGIEGTARAKIWNSGLGKLQLSNLPVKGVFTVGKRGEGGGDGDGDGDDGFSR